MKVYARARRPDGGLIRMSYPGDNAGGAGGARAADREQESAREEGRLDAGEDDGLGWWERWGMLGALEPSAYQRLF